jgi:Na+/proline symporter
MSPYRINIGRTDRVLRAALGIVALGLLYAGPRTPWGYVGIALLFTAAIGFCPLYALLGISTRSRSVS